MKFNDGFWLLKQGVRGYHGLKVTQSKETADGQGLELLVATRPIRHRGDTLGGPLLTINVHAPTEGVIGVRIDHFRHIDSTPQIPLFPDDKPIPKASISKSDASDVVSSGALSAEITHDPYTVTFKAAKKTLTFAGYKHQGIYDIPSKWTLTSAANSSCLATDSSSNPNPAPLPETVRYVHSELNISPGELFYGMGEQFGTFVKNGSTVRIWNQDGGTSSDQAYKCIPFYMSNRGYGVFVNHPGEVEFEVGTEKVSRIGTSVPGETLEFFVIHGSTPIEILDRYTRMTGRPALLPSWTFGLWLSTSFLTSYDTKTVSGFLQGMRDRQCDVRVFHLDCFWMKQYEWCSFTFDPEFFPDPKSYLSEIKEKYGVKICLWINPYISQHSPIFKEAVEGGYLIKRTDGTPWQWDLWQPGLGIVDVTNPAAVKWYQGKLSYLLNLGVDTFKTDFGERIPHAAVQFHDGSNPINMHNMYAVKYNELVFTLLEKRFGKGNAVVFARTAFVGGQRFPVHWGGDCESTFEAMAETIRGSLSLNLSGFTFSSHDIGGFEGRPPSELYQRWVAFGLFSSHSRLHGSGSYRIPWEYGEDAAKSMGRFVEAKHRLMPYLYGLAIKAHQNGHPLMRAMFLEFLQDRTTHTLDQQYMLGPSLLVAPVFVPQGEKSEYYIPAGKWTSYFDPQRTVEGPVWISEDVPIDEIPVWVRPGSIVCVGPERTGKPDYAYNRDLEVQVFELSKSVSVSVDVSSGDGATIVGAVTAVKEGKKVIVKVSSQAIKVKVVRVFESGQMFETKVDGASQELTVQL